MMTKIRDGYKETEIGNIPEEWEVDTLENICIPKGLVRGPFGGALKKEYFVEGGYKVYEQKNAINKNAFIGEYYVDHDKFDELKRFEVKSNDFIVSCSGTIGRIYQIPENHEKGIINQALLKITVNRYIINDLFFYNYFEWDNFQKKIIDNTQGGAMKNLVGMDIIKKTLFCIPPLPEQQRIAEIFSTTNSHIEKLDKTIEDYLLLKKGMMKKLLTEGIGHTEFKVTEIGMIPKEWEVVKQGEISLFYNGRAYKQSEFKENGTPVIRIQNITGEGRYVFSDLELEDNKYIEAGDLIYAWSATFGPYIWNGSKGIYHYHIWKIECTNRIDKMFYYYRLNQISDELGSKKNGSVFAHITKGFMENHLIGIPQLPEQHQIAEILLTIDNKIDKLLNQREDFIQLKKSLMEKLLTGKIRVELRSV